MKPKKAIKELRKQLKGDQGNVVVKIRLASLLRDIGEYGEAVHLYLAVAQAYLATDRIGQAIAVCKGILEFAPNDPATHQMWAYLEQSRQVAEMAEEAASPSPPVPSYSSPLPDDSRRKRPTSFPTPLSDGGPVSSLPMPGMPSTPGRGQRSHRASEPALATGPQRNARPTETGGHTLSPRRLEADVTLPGAPPTRTTNEFKLRDLSAAGAAQIGEATPYDEAHTQPKIQKLSATLRMPLADSAPAKKSAGPPRPPPPPAFRGADNRSTSTDTHTVPAKQSFRPRDLAPAPTPIPSDMISPPPLLDQGDTMDEGSDEPGLEDATIVDANFDMAKFILSQTSEGPDPSDADLPEIPIRSNSQEVTRIADEPQSLGVAVEKLGALRRLSDYALKALAAGATETEYPSGYMILSEGDASDTCYLLVSGELQVLKRNAMIPGSPIKEVTRLGPGALFGEYALVGDRRCLASVQTTMPSTVVEIPRTVIVSLTGRYPALRSSFELLYREILIESLMSTSRVFRVLFPDEWPEVLGLFEPVRAAVGQSIIAEGQRFGGFYLVLTGEVSVSSGGREAIRGLGAGFYVGEVSMLKGELARATVTAETSVEFARLDARRFYALVAGNERLWAHVWQESQRQELLELQLVAGVTANV